MKKSLLAVAVAAALPAAAFAQSNVTLYGRVDVGYAAKTWKDGVGGTHSKSSGVQEGSGGPNAIGMMGTEDLGGGMKATFVWEQGYSATRPEHTNMRAVSDGHLVAAAPAAENGYSMTSLNRQTYVAISGGFGELRGGYARTLQYDVTTTGGFVLCNEGATGCAIQVGAATPAGGLLTGTRGAGVRYTSPRIGDGLTVMVEYGAGNDLSEYVSVNPATLDLKNVRMGIGARYDAGALSVAAAHTSHKQGGPAITAGAVAPATVTTKLNQLSAIYRLPMVQVAVNLIDGDNGAAGAANADLSGWQVSANVPLGSAFSIAGGFGKQKLKTTAATVSDISSWQIGGKYALSKRTAAYAYYGNTDDKAIVAAGVAKDKTMTVVGMVHNF